MKTKNPQNFESSQMLTTKYILVKKADPNVHNNHCHSFSLALSLKSLKCQSELTCSGARISTPFSVTRANWTWSIEWQSLS